MKAFAAFSFTVLLILGAIDSPQPAAAKECRKGCGRQTAACAQTARVRMLACKQACRVDSPGGGLGACIRSCTADFGSAKKACGGERANCLAICPPPPPPTSCSGAFLDSCGQKLATCAQAVVAQAKSCLRGCGPSLDRLGCLQQCATAAQAGAAACAEAFATCLGTCGPPTTTTTIPAACQRDQDCDDGNSCTADICSGGACQHACMCVGPAGAATCCPGPGLCPPPVGRCFVTVDNQCTDEPCGPGQPCRNPNEICRPDCLTATTTTTLPQGGCTTDADCNDGNPCTADRCINGTCDHVCICVGAAGASTCCPGPSALCIRPCGVEPTGTCGGFCPGGATCEAFRPGSVCGCVSGLGGPCGGNVLGSPIACDAGLVCKQTNPDATGVCVDQPSCIPFFQPGCTQTSDCCEPCGNGRIAPCAVCLQGQCMGAP
jgi:hypothetical protein